MTQGNPPKVEYQQDPDPNKLIEELMRSFPQLSKLFLKKVRHYFLKDHTRLVLSCFQKYFNHARLPVSKDLFLIFLALHDIGKPIAAELGDKGNQHFHTQKIIKELWPYLPYSNDDLKVVLALSQCDCIGGYFQHKISLDEVVAILAELADKANINTTQLFRLFIIYYQCDTSAYTADGGGFKFLEHLFQYKNGVKVYDEESGLLKMSDFYWGKYLLLEKAVLKR